MAEYIDREAAISVLCDACGNAACPKGLIPRCSYYEKMQSIPAADVRPVVKGFNKLKDYPTLFECSACGRECDDTMPGDTATYNFCPNCGAMMEEN